MSQPTGFVFRTVVAAAAAAVAVPYRRVKKLLPQLALAATAAGAVTRSASAQLLYDPFDYPAGATLEGQVNPVNARPWFGMIGNGGDDVLVAPASVSLAGFAAPRGGSVAYAGTGTSPRLSLGPQPISSGTIYYSLALQVTSLGQMAATPVFVAGFSNRQGPSGVQPTTVGTRLYLRESANSSPESPLFNVGVSKNSSTLGDIAFANTDYPLNVPLLVVGSYQVVGGGSGTDDVARLYVNPSSLGTHLPPTTSTPASPILTAPVAGTDLTDGGQPAIAGFVLRQGTGVPGVQVDELRVDQTWAQVTPPIGATWLGAGGGSWFDPSRWSTASPPDGSAFVNFSDAGGAGGAGGGARTITLDASASAHTINFASADPYTLAGAGSLNLQATGAINVIGPAGHHVVDVPLNVPQGLMVNVRSGGTLTLARESFTAALSKGGAGTLEVKRLAAGDLSVREGGVRILPRSGASAPSRVDVLALAPTTRLDVTDNSLIVDSGVTGSWDGTRYTGITGLVQSGRNDGTWDGAGIVTSMPAALTDYTTVGVARAGDVLGISESETDTWAGQTVRGDATLIRYTYGGDANLDGVINIDDYGQIDFNAGLSGLVFGYFNGDFNLDGLINIDDYGVIDFNVGIQGPPLGDASLAFTPVTAVPEPAMVGLTTFALLAARRRRQ